MFASISDTLLMDGLNVIFYYSNSCLARLSIFTLSSSANSYCRFRNYSRIASDSLSSMDTGLISGANVSCCCCLASWFSVRCCLLR